MSDISKKVIEKNVNNEFSETLTNSAEYGIISQRDFFDKDISNEKNLNTYYVVHDGDFVYNPRISNYAPVGPIKRNTLGRTGVMSPLYYVFTTYNVDGTYLEKYFSSTKWHRFMEMNGDTGARSDRFAIKDKDFVQMPIPLPRLDEQVKIARFLKDVENLITANQQSIKIKRKRLYMAEERFEEDLIDRLAGRNGLKTEGWTYNDDLSGSTSEKLYDHWRDILNRNNRNRLNGTPLTDAELGRLRQEINNIKTPYEAQLILTGAGGIGSLPLQRDDGTPLEIEIFYGDEVAGGHSEYEIVKQITFTDLPSSLTSKRRIDIMMLINGIPVAHIEEKDERLANQWDAFEQLKKYADSGMYQGLFSFVQIQFILSQHSAHYFARPKDTESYNPDFVFGWRDDNGKDITNAMDFLHQTMGIPALHRLVTVNMIPDESTNNLMVMRSYQIQATRQILDRMRVMEHNGLPEKEGGYVWHTTGSGKTVTSFKVAQLLANMPRVEDVFFIVDRVDLVNQTYENFKGFAYKHMEKRIKNVNSATLRRELNNTHPANIYMISVQGLDALVRDGNFKSDKRMVILMDEAHRSASGDSVKRIKDAFPKTTWFGFTGTPNFYSDESNDVKTTRDVSTADVFGKRLHQYTIKDAIGDRNVLGFDVSYMEPNIEISDKNLTEKDIEREVYSSAPYREQVVEDIAKNWDKNASGELKANVREKNVFHGMLAVSGKQAVVAYYKLFKKHTNLRVAMSYSKNDDNGFGDADLQSGLKQAMTDYSEMYGTRNFLDSDNPERDYLNDITKRIAHKKPYNRKDDKERLDLVIVSDQLLTGFDSKYVNIIYMDKLLKEGLLIQAMSRTNRTINRNAKPYGKVRFFRKGQLMEENVKNALIIYTKGGNDTLNEKKPTKDPGWDLLIDDGIIAGLKSDQIKELIPKIDRLREISEDFTQNPKSEKERQELILLGLDVSRKVQRLIQQGYSLGEDLRVVDLDGNETGETITLNLASDNEFGALQARIYDANDNDGDGSIVDLTDIAIAIEQYNEEVIDYDQLVDLLNSYIDEQSQANRDAVEEHIMPMDEDGKEEIRDVLESIDNKDITEHLTTETLKQERRKSRGLRTELKMYKWADEKGYNGRDVVDAYEYYIPGIELTDNPKLGSKLDDIKKSSELSFLAAASFEKNLMEFFKTL
ncbi:HsdR family type I site-specific deoxyribonuclease [Weissella ceti]|nr:HsdR family type I site-specific deoxyribonuclease [Weissella ceti]